MNILVTGAAGFIGSHLCQALVKKGNEVFALSRSGRTDNIKSLLPHANFHLKIGDVRNTEPMRRLIKDNCIEVVFHLAARLPDGNDLKDPFVYFDSNARGTLNLLNADERVFQV